MKIKTIVTGMNRKQVRSLALEQQAKIEELKGKLDKVQKLANGCKAKLEISDRLLFDTKDQLVAARRGATSAANLNIELAKENAELERNISSLEEKLRERDEVIAALKRPLIKRLGDKFFN